MAGVGGTEGSGVAGRRTGLQAVRGEERREPHGAPRGVEARAGRVAVPVQRGPVRAAALLRRSPRPRGWVQTAGGK